MVAPKRQPPTQPEPGRERLSAVDFGSTRRTLGDKSTVFKFFNDFHRLSVSITIVVFASRFHHHAPVLVAASASLIMCLLECGSSRLRESIGPSVGDIIILAAYVPLICERHHSPPGTVVIESSNLFNVVHDRTAGPFNCLHDGEFIGCH